MPSHDARGKSILPGWLPDDPAGRRLHVMGRVAESGRCAAPAPTGALGRYQHRARPNILGATKVSQSRAAELRPSLVVTHRTRRAYAGPPGGGRCWAFA